MSHTHAGLPTTANPHATPAARRVLALFHSAQSRGRVISGQFTNFGRRADLRLPRRIHALTGEWPSLIGVDYSDFEIKSGRRETVQWLMNAISRAKFHLITETGIHTQKANRTALRYWRAGGLVTVGVHFTNPANPHGGGLRDRGLDLAELLRKNTATRRRWLKQLDEIAGGLAELRDAGVVVLWRPFHEMNGGWFWWGQPKPAVFARVWRDMFDYFSRIHRLDNLLWVYAPNMGDDAAACYPGDAFTDLVGLDAYTSSLDQKNLRGYSALTRLGRPFGFSEYGPQGSYAPNGDFDYRRFSRALRLEFPRACYFMAWNANWSPACNLHARSLYRDARVLNRSELSLLLDT